MKKYTPLQAIREKCLNCMCWQKREVRLCPSDDCTLHPYRFGHQPSRKGMGNPSPDFGKRMAILRHKKLAKK